MENFLSALKFLRISIINIGNGKLSLYAENGIKDANGYFTNFIIGGAGNNADNDKEGPVIKAYLNDEKFVNGSIANENPVLIVKA